MVNTNEDLAPEHRSPPEYVQPKPGRAINVAGNASHVAGEDDEVKGPRVIVVERDGEKYEALSTPDAESGIGGLSHATAAGEVGGGNITAILEPPKPLAEPVTALSKERKALLSPIGRKLSGHIGRPVAEWGLIGEGEIVKGMMLLIDLETGEKVRGMDGHKIGEGKLYANAICFPQALIDGDVIKQVLEEV